jgi:hypothetical protein
VGTVENAGGGGRAARYTGCALVLLGAGGWIGLPMPFVHFPFINPVSASRSDAGNIWPNDHLNELRFGHFAKNWVRPVA